MVWIYVLPAIALLAGGAVAAVPKLWRALERCFDRLRRPSLRLRVIIAVIIFVLSLRYFQLSAELAGRSFTPVIHDEFMYLLQARMLSHGRLWMPQHELADFFDSFNIIVKPVYAADYFPGTALLYVPGMWLDLRPWMTSLAITSSCVVMMYLITTQLIDGAFGILAALLLVSLEQVRTISVSVMSHPAMMLLALLMLWSYLRWRKRPSFGWALAIGVFAGWGAITRPLDAICMATPVGLAIAWDLWRLAPSRLRSTAITTAALLIGAAPFLALQLVFDRGVTGHWLQTPFVNYNRATFPGLSFGFGPHAVGTPATAVPQIHDYYNKFMKNDLLTFGRGGFLHVWLVDRLFAMIRIALPHLILLTLFPIGLLAARTPPRIALVSWAITVSLAYAFYPSYLRHYGLVVVPAFVTLVLLGAEMLRKWSPRAGAGLFVAIAIIAIGSLPEVHGGRDRYQAAPFLDHIHDEIAQLPVTPAVVLFHYAGRTDVHEEPVFNIETPWPDDAKVIRAHDLGPENWRIFKYYAQRQPRRFFYRYDRSGTKLEDLAMKPLGWADDLARKYPGPPGHR